MINKLALPVSLLALISSIGFFIYSQQKSDLVYVDINKMVEGYNRTAMEREAFNKKVATMKANVDSLMNTWQNELKLYEKERPGMSDKEIQLKQELLQNKQQQINNYQQAIQKQIQEEDQKMTQTVLNDINDYVREYGKRKGNRIIFGARGNGNIMFAEQGADLTDRMLQGLNAEYNGN